MGSEDKSCGVEFWLQNVNSCMTLVKLISLCFLFLIYKIGILLMVGGY